MRILDKDMFDAALSAVFTERKVVTYVLLFFAMLFYMYGEINNVSEKLAESREKRETAFTLIHKYEGICDNSTCWRLIGKINIEIDGSPTEYRVVDKVNAEDYDSFVVGNKYTHTYTVGDYDEFEFETHLFFKISYYIIAVCIFVLMCWSKLDD